MCIRDRSTPATFERPTDCKTINIITKPAEGIPAAPIDARRAVNTIVNCCTKVKSIPGKICAINSTPAHSYNAVPSILTVAPKGKTKPEVVFETLTLSRTQDIVTGRVALEELVENAIIIAFLIALKWYKGEIDVNI